MFIWDFVADTVLGQIFDWVYGKIVEFLGEFFSMMNGMGSELFEFVWVQAVVESFATSAGRSMVWASWSPCLRLRWNTSPGGPQRSGIWPWEA